MNTPRISKESNQLISEFAIAAEFLGLSIGEERSSTKQYERYRKACADLTAHIAELEEKIRNEQLEGTNQRTFIFRPFIYIRNRWTKYNNKNTC